MNKLLRLFGYKLCKLPTVTVSDEVAAFAMEIDAALRYDPELWALKSRYGLFDRIRTRALSLEDAVYDDRPAWRIRDEATQLATVVLRIASVYGELLPHPEETLEAL